MTSASAFYFDSSNLESNPLFGPVAPNPTAPLTVAYQGEPGAYSEQAIRQLFGRSSYPNLRPYACASFSSVFAALQKREAEYALLPIENSLGGSIHDNYDLLLRHRVTIVAELQFRVSHCLLALPGVSIDDIKVVYSHPQALAQCEEYLNKIGKPSEKQYDTAGSAKMIAEKQLRHVGAIASELAGETYGLQIVARKIEDDESNFTRFLLLAPTTIHTQQATLYTPQTVSIELSDDETDFTRSRGASAAGPGRIYHPNVANLNFSSNLTRTTFKTSMVFTLPDAPGTLFKALSVFALRDMHMCKIESRPCKNINFLADDQLFTFADNKRLTMSSAQSSDDTSALSSASAEFKYLFFIDTLSSLSQNESLKNGLRHLKEYAPFLRVLGSYPVFQVLTQQSGNTSSTDSGVSGFHHRQLSSFTSPPAPRIRPLRIGIIGFGTFGQFLSKTFVRQGHELFVWSRSDYSALSTTLGVKWCKSVEDLMASQLDVLILSVSILSFEATVKSLPFEKLRNCLIVDVLSVKEHPRQILLETVNNRCGGDKSLDILCTHPMFGPQSGGVSWKGLPFMYDRVSINNDERCQSFLRLFESEGCRMLEMSSELHDTYAAGSQFLTHTTGRILDKLQCISTPINTTGYTKLLQVIEQTQKDSWELYAGLYKFNSKSRQQLEHFARVFDELKMKLKQMVDDDTHESKSSTTAASSSSSSSSINFHPNPSRMNESKTVAIAGLTKKLQGEGIPILSLAVGEVLSIKTPPQIIEAATLALTEGRTTYTAVNGLLQLREKIAEKLKKENGLTYTPDEILVSNGAKQSIYQVLQALIVPGREDEVIIPSPYWVSYPDMTTLVGGTPVIVDTNNTNYILTPERLEQAITSRTKVLILCSPSNPTGVVYTRQQLEALAAVVRRHPRIIVVSDEIYEHLIFAPSTHPHISFASLGSDMFARTVTVNGFSKGYVMTGFRVGYIAAPLAITSMCVKIQGQITSCASSISQYAALSALSLPESFRRDFVAGLNETRQMMLNELRKIPNTSFTEPLGAFYVLLQCKQYFATKTKDGKEIRNSDDLAFYLLDSHRVATVPGSAFGAPDCIRISYASSSSIVQDAMKAVATGLAQLTKQ